MTSTDLLLIGAGVAVSTTGVALVILRPTRLLAAVGAILALIPIALLLWLFTGGHDCGVDCNAFQRATGYQLILVVGLFGLLLVAALAHWLWNGAAR